jgi:hypothetical protein
MSTFLVAAFVAGLTSTGQATSTPSAKSLPLPVTVFDYANIPAQWLSWAKESMSRIYGEIGVEIMWQDARSEARTGLIVLILPESRSTKEGIPESVIGYTSGTADERRRVAYVLYGRMDQFRLEQAPAIQRANLLGHLMAHEVGHLLLPVQSHSPSGIMRARWSRADLELAQQGRLRFSADQAQSIRSKVSRLAEDRRGAQAR